MQLLDAEPESAEFSDQRLMNQNEASDAVAFANVDAKIRYDFGHTPLLLQAGDRAYLRLIKDIIHRAFKTES